MRTRTLVAVGLLVALLLAGVVSFYASTHPDGLTRVAQDQGITATERDHAADDGPFAGYQTTGVEDGRLSTGLAGVVGTLVVLALAGGLTWAVRRGRRPEADPADGPEAPGQYRMSADRAGQDRAGEARDADLDRDTDPARDTDLDRGADLDHDADSQDRRPTTGRSGQRATDRR